MIMVNNKKAIWQLAKNSFQSNKLRNIFAIVAIVLTTVLFTGLFTVVSSMLATAEENTMRQVGSNAHGGFKALTMEQYDKLKIHKSIKDISYSVVLGIAENKELAKRPSEIRYTFDEITAKSMFSMPTIGRLPQNDDEIAADTILLECLGVSAELGQKVTLEYSVSGKKQCNTFTLVGFWQGDNLMKASQIWLNRTFVENQLKNYIPVHENDLIGKISANVYFSNSFFTEGKLLKVITDSGYLSDEIAYGVNWAYLSNSGSIDAETMLGSAVIILMIVFCGYLIISNVFYISVAKDIRFYGLLKTIGTTGKQIRFLIHSQALLLCVIGIPFGILIGIFVGTRLTPIMLSMFNNNVIKISFHPITFIGSALFAIFTVIISVARPSKIAAGISPMEALRSTDGTQTSKKTIKKNGRINLWKMAQDNVFRNKKKTILVTISLSLSLIILNSAYSVANSFDMNQYLSGMIGSDFAIGDVSCFNHRLHYSNQDTLNQDFLNSLAEKDGIEKISSIYFAEPPCTTDQRLIDLPTKAEKEFGVSGQRLEFMKEEITDPTLLQHIYGLDRNAFDELTILEGRMNYEKLETGQYVIAGPYDDEGILNYYNVGDKVELASVDGSEKEYEVLAIATIPSNISIKHSHPITPEFFLPSDIFLQHIDRKAPMLTTLDVEDRYITEMELYLSDYCQTIDPSMHFESKATFAAEYEGLQRTFKSVGIILSLIVAFIGVMNFINTIITSILSRKCELAMLQSIGMTNQQMQTMLVSEGLIYTVLTAMFALTIGSILGYSGIYLLTAGGIYINLQFTVLPSLLCLPILTIISILVPHISQHILCKNSVIERLRSTE